jgi:transposase
MPRLRQRAKDRLLDDMRRYRDATLKTDDLIVVNLIHGQAAEETGQAVEVDRPTVFRVAGRFRECGESGLVDRREANGEPKLGERYLAIFYDVVTSSPQEHGWLRPIWTREMLVITLDRKSSGSIDVAILSFALKRIGAQRRGPKPTVACLWWKQAKNRRLNAFHELIAQLPAEGVVVYQDEVDNLLNLKIGPDWIVRAQQKEVPIPEQNAKRYLAAAQDIQTGALVWAEREQKTSFVFIRLLWSLAQPYHQARRIHVILDNYAIHSTQQVDLGLASTAGRKSRLHFQPPYSPDNNKIERMWQDLHANVTRNHMCTDISNSCGRSATTSGHVTVPSNTRRTNLAPDKLSVV